ncbi:amino acid transporter [Hortaea werneckii]|nr:amino acid transporter [Hortaea werneckii]
MVALSFDICNSWAAIASTLAVAINAGGPVTLLYGIILAFVVYAAVAASLAELAGIYPIAGGQYHFTSILAPKRFHRSLSYACGLIAAFSWTALGASATILSAQMLLSVAEYYYADYVPLPWHYFLVYQAINVALLLYNLFALRATPWVHNIGLTITCLAFADFRSSDYVWTTFESQTGWPAGVTFLTGWSTPCFMYAGIDGTLHLAEKCTDPVRVVHRALLSTVLIGFLTAFGFAIAMCYSINDLLSLLNTTMPIYALWRQATGSATASTIFLIALMLVVFFVVNAVQQTASHLIWTLGRDNGFLFSNRIGTMHPTLHVPVWGLLVNAGLIFIAGCIYLASTQAFNAFINSTIILKIVSFAMPCCLLLWQGRKEHVLPRERGFCLPQWLGWTANLVTIAAAVVELVFFDFPTSLPVTGEDMNYTCGVLGVIALLSGANWFCHARTRYDGPRFESMGFA